MRIDVILNPAIVGFSQLIPGYKQTVTVTASQCPTIHNRVITCLINLPLISVIPRDFFQYIWEHYPYPWNWEFQHSFV